MEDLLAERRELLRIFFAIVFGWYFIHPFDIDAAYPDRYLALMVARNGFIRDGQFRIQVEKT